MKTTVVSIIATLAITFCVSTVVAKDKAAKAPATTKPATTKPAAATPPAAAQVIEISVTKAGFIPSEIKVKVGQPVKLMITRKVDNTCAKDIVIKDYGINQPLPLNKTMEINFTPTKAGSSRFACAMDMIAGVIVAEL
jgi:plastocyanin domain-containing protein